MTIQFIQALRRRADSIEPAMTTGTQTLGNKLSRMQRKLPGLGQASLIPFAAADDFREGIRATNEVTGFLEEHQVSHQTAVAMGLTTGITAYTLSTLPSTMTFLASYSQNGKARRTLAELAKLYDLDKAQNETYMALRAGEAGLQQAYEKLNLYLGKLQLTREERCAIILDLETYRIAYILSHGKPRDVTQTVIAQIDKCVSGSVHPVAKRWQHVASDAVKRQPYNQQLLLRHLHLAAAQEIHEMNLRLSPSQRDHYVSKYIKSHNTLTPKITTQESFEVDRFGLQGQSRALFLAEREKFRNLHQDYVAAFSDMKRICDAFTSKEDKRRYACFGDREAKQRLLIAMEINRLSHDKKPHLHPQYILNLLALADYNAIVELSRQADSYLREKVVAASPKATVKIGRFRYPRERYASELLAMLAEQAAAEESKKYFEGGINHRFVEFRQNELHGLHNMTIESYDEYLAKKLFISPITALAGGALGGFKAYNATLGLSQALGVGPVVAIYFAISSAIRQAISSKDDAKEIASTAIRSFYPNSPQTSSGNPILKSPGKFSAALMTSAATTGILAYFGYGAIMTVLTGSALGVAAVAAGPIAIAIVAVTSLVALAIFYKLSHARFDYMLDALSTAYHKSKNAEGINKVTTFLRALFLFENGSHWERNLKIVGIILGVLVAGVTVFSIAAAFSNPVTLILGAVAGLTLAATLIAPSIYTAAGKIGKWLHEHNVGLFEAVGMLADKAISFGLPIVAAFGAVAFVAIVSAVPGLAPIVGGFALALGLSGSAVLGIDKDTRRAAIPASIIAATLGIITLVYPPAAVVTLPLLAAAVMAMVVMPKISKFIIEPFAKRTGIEGVRSFGKVIDASLRGIRHIFSSDPKLAKPAIAAAASAAAPAGVVAKAPHSSHYTIDEKLGFPSRAKLRMQEHVASHHTFKAFVDQGPVLKEPIPQIEDDDRSAVSPRNRV